MYKTLLFLLTLSLLSVPGLSSAKAKKQIPKCQKKLTLTIGNKKKLKIKSKGIAVKKKSFKSTNKKIATVNRKGIVKVKNAGSCKIKAKIKYQYKNKLKNKEIQYQGKSSQPFSFIQTVCFSIYSYRYSLIPLNSPSFKMRGCQPSD